MKISIPPEVFNSSSPSTFAKLCDELQLKTDAAKEALQVSLENIILLDRKHQDYGSTNIAQSGAYGCVVRMGDKWARLNHLYTQKRRRTINEPILDSFRDISNYGLIAILLESNKWPST